MNRINTINKLLGINDSYQAPDRLLKILYDKSKRESLFMKLLEEFNYDVGYDWFHEYFQDEHADRKNKKQDFTPGSIGNLMARLVGDGTGSTYDGCAGTGGLIIKRWDYQRRLTSPFDYDPSEYLYTCEELSDRAIPFLLFNLLIRGMNAIVIHCDVLSRKSYGVFFIQNDKNDHMQFSSLNVMPYSEGVSEFLMLNFVDERYKPLVESKEFPKHLLRTQSQKEEQSQDEQLTLF